jgi:hypothetical protein
MIPHLTRGRAAPARPQKLLRRRYRQGLAEHDAVVHIFVIQADVIEVRMLANDGEARVRRVRIDQGKVRVQPASRRIAFAYLGQRHDELGRGPMDQIGGGGEVHSRRPEFVVPVIPKRGHHNIQRLINIQAVNKLHPLDRRKDVLLRLRHRAKVRIDERHGEIGPVPRAPRTRSKNIGGTHGRSAERHHAMVRTSSPGTVSRPLPVGKNGVIPAAVRNDVGIHAVTHGAPVDLILFRNPRYQVSGRFETIEMVSAVARLVVSVGVVLAIIIVVRIRDGAFAGMRPAVIFRMRKRCDVLAIERVERVEPDLIVVGGGIRVVRGDEGSFATVHQSIESWAQALVSDRADGNEMDYAGVVAEGAGHGVGNVVGRAGILGGREDRGALAIEDGLDCGRARLLGCGWGGHLCRS